MNVVINAKQLRALLPRLVKRVRAGVRYTVLYRSRPAFQIIPVDEVSDAVGLLEDDPLYRSRGVGRSTDGRTSEDHDSVLYGD